MRVPWKLLPLVVVLASVLGAQAATVTTDAELRAAITIAVDGDTITFANDITLAGDLPAVQKSITIDGANHALDGANTYRGLFFAAWTPGTATFIPVTAIVRNLVIQRASARGGNSNGGFSGAGGGAGLGGAIFVANLAQVTVSNVTLSSNSAVGGSSGSGYRGGGGGMGGNGGGNDNRPASGGGGGLGRGADGGLGAGANGSTDRINGQSGIATGAAPGGTPGGGFVGGASGGGGAGGNVFQSGSGGGVGGAGPGSFGGAGGFGGGGGGGFVDAGGGAGGFGGGGGVAGGSAGGAGGFGGGGGGFRFAGTTPGAGGFGGGDGALQLGGGGAGMGGAIFVMEGGSLTLTGSLTINGNTVTGGTGANAGSAFGNGIFAQGGNAILSSPAAGETQTIGDGIADQIGSGGGSGSGVALISKNGAGTLVFAGTNTIADDIAVYDGTLLLNGTNPATGGIYVGNGGILGGSGGTAGTITFLGTLEGDAGPLSMGALEWGSGTIAATLSPTSQALSVTGALTKIGNANTLTLALTDGGVTPGATYTLLTFGSQSGYRASDFTVTGISGKVTLEAHALKFTVAATPIPPTYGVAMRVARGKNRATFTVTNTGNTATGFRLTAIPAGGSAQVLMKVKVRKTLRFQRSIRTTLSATSQAAPSKAASASVKLTLKPDTK